MYLKPIVISGVLLMLFGSAASAAGRAEETLPSPRPLGSDIPAFHAEPPRDGRDRPEEAQAAEEPAGTLTLRQALALALMRNPELRAFSWEVRAQEAVTLQAGLLPNPQAGADIENIGGSGSGDELTLRLGQLIELGGKRSARIQAASLTRDLAGWDYETKRIDVFTAVSQLFTEVLSAQRGLALTEETVRLAEQIAITVSERVRAGKVSPIEETRANVALSAARIELERAKRVLEGSRKRLAATWGGLVPVFEKAEGNLDSAPPIPSFEELAGRLSKNPELARWATEISQRRAIVHLERSQAVPDLFINGGYRRFRETGDNTFVVGITVPFPIFNRNQGRIQEARHRLARAEEERRTAEVRVNTALAEAYRDLSASHAEVGALKENVLPGAESAFEAVSEGYRLGKFGILDVLDAQRTLFGARAQYLRALINYHQAAAEVERLIGEPLIQSAPGQKQ